MREIRISVIITCHDEGELVLRAMDSLRHQTDRDFEAVVIKDVSGDARTEEICKDIEKKGLARVIRLGEHGGLSAARNKGFSVMNGDVAVFLDADDILPSRAIEYIKEGFRDLPDADFVFGDYLIRDTDTEKKETVDCGALKDGNGFLNPGKLTGKWGFLGTSPCKKSLWEKAGGYSGEFSYSVQDMDFWIRAIMTGSQGAYVNKVIYEWNRSASGMNSVVSRWDMARMRAKNIAFYDRFGDGKSKRRELAGIAFELGDMQTAKKLHIQLIKLGKISVSGLMISLLPVCLTGFMHRLNNLSIGFFALMVNDKKTLKRYK